MKILLYGSKGWIGGQFTDIMKKSELHESTDFVLGTARANNIEALKKETPTSMWLNELDIVKEQYIQYKLNRQERQKGSGVKKVKVKRKKVKVKQLKN